LWMHRPDRTLRARACGAPGGAGGSPAGRQSISALTLERLASQAVVSEAAAGPPAADRAKV
jgi:hypothetical protein